MSLADQAVAELESTEQFFNRSTRSLTEEHSGVKPAPDVMTAAQQVAHAAPDDRLVHRRRVSA